MPTNPQAWHFWDWLSLSYYNMCYFNSPHRPVKLVTLTLLDAALSGLGVCLGLRAREGFACIRDRLVPETEKVMIKHANLFDVLQYIYFSLNWLEHHYFVVTESMKWNRKSISCVARYMTLLLGKALWVKVTNQLSSAIYLHASKPLTLRFQCLWPKPTIDG